MTAIADTRADFAPEEPTPLFREIPSGDPFPLHALGPLRPAAEAAHDLTQAPAAIAAQSALAVAALAVQGHGDVETLGGRAPVSLYVLTIAQSGERKSACDRLLMRGVQEFQRELVDAAVSERTAHATRHAVWDQQRRTILKQVDKGSASARADLEALGPEPEAPLLPFIMSTEPTFEALAKHMSLTRPSLGIFSDEGGAFIGGHAMKEENRLRTVAGLSSMWDGAPVNRWRAGDGVDVHLGRRLSVHLMVQPVAAAGLLADPIANGQGFLARFLVTEPASTVGTRLSRAPAPGSIQALDLFAASIVSLLRRDLPLRSGTRNELDPPSIELDSAARALLARFHDMVEKAQIKGGELETVRAVASKAAEHAARIAGVLTLFENPDARIVTAETMALAVTLATFYINEAKRLTDAATISGETADAEALRRWLIESWQDALISAADAAQCGPARLRETGYLRKLLGILAIHGWVHPVEGGGVVRGRRRREVWRIHGRRPA